MDIFFSLFSRLIPLFLIVGLGFVSGRFLQVSRQSIANLLIYIVAPIVFFTNVSQADLKPGYVWVPFLIYGVGCAISYGAFRLGGAVFGNGITKHLIAFASGTANSGYFGIPVAIMLYGPEIVGVMVLFIIGFTIFENTYGYYILARGKFTAKEALARVVRLPAIYALITALIVNKTGWKMNGVLLDFSGFFRGTYSVLGMMMVGLGISEIRRFQWDLKFTSFLFAMKFLVWPAVIFAFVLLDRAYLGWYDDSAHRLLILLSACPIAANTVAFASLLHAEPERAGMATLLSTVFALVYIPLVVVYLV